MPLSQCKDQLAWLCRGRETWIWFRRQRRETAAARHKGPNKTSDKTSATSLAHAMCAKSASGRGLRAHARSAEQGRGKRDKGTCSSVQGRERAAAAGFLGQERRADQARGAGAASRWQRRGTRSSGRAAAGSVDFASFTLSPSPPFCKSGFPRIHNTAATAAGWAMEERGANLTRGLSVRQEAEAWASVTTGLGEKIAHARSPCPVLRRS